MVTMKNENTVMNARAIGESMRRRARSFLVDSGADRVPPDLRWNVVDAYLAWLDDEPGTQATFPPGTLAVLSAELPDAGPAGSTHLEFPCRVEGNYSQDLRLVVVPTPYVPVEYRQTLDDTEGWWSAGLAYVTVATVNQLRPRVDGPRQIPAGEIWDPMAVVLRAGKAWTVGDELDERVQRAVSGDDEDGCDEDGW